MASAENLTALIESITDLFSGIMSGSLSHAGEGSSNPLTSVSNTLQSSLAL